jgi:hypothetical protein
MEQVVLITRASRGFGEAAARECAARSRVQATILEPGVFRSDWQTGSLDVCAAMPDDLWEQHIRTQGSGYRRRTTG